MRGKADETRRHVDTTTVDDTLSEYANHLKSPSVAELRI